MRSDYEQKNDKPTICSIWDTIAIIERRYGLNWHKDDAHVAKVVLASQSYSDEHIQEELPEIWPLCLEFKEKGTINDKKINSEFNLLTWLILG